ncbi:hypothetical protein [Mycolicibacterium smegmatis]|uniref:Uncharacterized protein n=3 Tax=Mycolicibacterium smegmatis TaxID=1772 RepID=A0R4B0_MYCS2|nr:hypothetical protein [Mycolicibacterium smegmatis]ABK74754.1 hypothetical protein MSMEG_5769 [Mycolicibacterium smegmatis MC2 155]AFP42052.1 hypothetical protein MSMEI_5616 [Mycolicibacterium smegmatis MC2 155]AIU10779.1 hypothetical protein LJ00_28530 [Mycolicibacterium smegmatis MC2 155]AIU17404.1 hypothetical protein LI99_28535 [Mycolicibacterium smegmatis]AIU24027.1 hypothetical protein LI98_28540 [Mycolicibacterium smegmatis]
MKIELGTVLGVSTAGCALAFCGAGMAAAAPDVVGQPYSDAVTAIEDGGGTPHVAVTVGSRLPQDECIVTNAWTTTAVVPMTDDVYWERSDNVVQLSLNCAGDHATATNPGASVASTLGREAKEAADEAATSEESELAEVSTPDE